MAGWARRTAGAAALLAASAALVGCGDDGDDSSTGDEQTGGSASSSAFVEQEGAEIRDAAATAMGDLESLRVSGEVAVDGEEVSIEISTSRGGDCSGTVGFGGADAEVLSVDGQTWFRPSEEFWRASAGPQADQIIEVVDGRWVVLGEDEGFAELCDLDQLLEELLEDTDEATTYETGEVTDVDGTEAVAVVSTDEDGESSTGYIAVEEPHHLLLIERTEGDEQGSVTFTDFDEPVEVEAPADDETVDLDSL